MKLLITGACGFVGASLIEHWSTSNAGFDIIGIDNFTRAGSETNAKRLREFGFKLFRSDIRCASDFEALPKVDYVIDAAAMPSVLAGVDGKSSSRQLVEHNLLGTVNILEYCKRVDAGFVLLSTSRVYSIEPLARMTYEVRDSAFTPVIDHNNELAKAVTPAGVRESFPTAAPISLYGATKLASEALALEYGSTFNLPVWVNRCGVIAGAGQFGHAEQGIFSFWLHSWLHRRPLKYIGYDGTGHQVRDALHPRDLARLIEMQLRGAGNDRPRLCNVAGGLSCASSLAQLSRWCENRFGPHEVARDMTPRPFDIPWLILDSSRAANVWNWAPTRTLDDILTEIADFAEANPNWLDDIKP